jgi:hypothetical protein
MFQVPSGKIGCPRLFTLGFQFLKKTQSSDAVALHSAALRARRLNRSRPPIPGDPGRIGIWEPGDFPISDSRPGNIRIPAHSGFFPRIGKSPVSPKKNRENGGIGNPIEILTPE